MLTMFEARMTASPKLREGRENIPKAAHSECSPPGAGRAAAHNGCSG